jgi:integrase
MKQRGNITKRGTNSWQLKFDVPSRDGKRQQRYATVRGAYKDAQKELTRLLGAADADALPDPTRVTVGEYIRTWLSSAHEVSPKTLERYGELAEKQIIPHLGATPLQKLKPEAVTMWHVTLLESGLSARTVGHAHRLLRLILARAVKNNTLTRNVATIHSPPKVEEREVPILPVEQIPAILEALEGHMLHPIVSLALATGMRRGELLALQWGDVDLGAGTLSVKQSLEETKAGLRVKPPKTKKGRRKISLPPDTVAMLRAHKVKQMETRLVLGMGKPDETTLVLSDIEGRLISPHSVSRAWRMACKTRKLPRVPFHALRHTHVSVLIGKGVDILTISRRLGHSKASVTLDVYGHLIDGADEAAAKAIGEVLIK